MQLIVLFYDLLAAAPTTMAAWSQTNHSECDGLTKSVLNTVSPDNSHGYPGTHPKM
jgi:hypothetical protein